MRLYLIRHAHTQPDPQADAAQWSLSARGQAQAQILARQPFWAEVTHIVVSSEAKTRLTVEPVLTQRQLPLLVDPRFDELRRGGWSSDAEYVNQVQLAFAQPAQPAGEWEAAAHALQRLRSGIADLVVRYPGATLALVGHGLLLSLYRAALRGQATVPLADWQQLGFAAVALVDPTAGRLLQDFTPVQ